MATSKKKRPVRRAPTPSAKKNKSPSKTAPVGRRFTEAELAELAVAWEARDGATLARVSRRAGVLVTLANVDAIAVMSIRNQPLFPGAQVLATIGEALESSAGIAVREVHRFMQTRICLVAINGDTLVVAFGTTQNQGDTVPTIWPALRPWFRDLPRNRARIDTWLANAPNDSYHSHGRVALALVPPDAIAGDAARIAELREAIVATPDDDTPRLVLADLLQQRGDPLGTLIALECKLAQLGEVDTPEVGKLTSSVQALFDTHRAAFEGDVARCATEVVFERGFVSRVTMTAPTFAANGERLFAQLPIQTLQLRPLTSATIAKLAVTPALARVRHLVLRHEIGAEKNVGLTALATSKHLDMLETLGLENFITTERDWVQAFGSLGATRLRRVTFQGDSLSTAALAALAANPHLPALAELEIYSHKVASRHDPAVHRKLFEALAARTTLRYLQLEQCARFDVSAAHTLFAGPGGRQLHKLCIEDKRFDDAALAEMTRVPLELREFEVGDSPISNTALDRFLRSRGGAHVERIWIHPGCPNLSHQQLADDVDKLPSSHPLRALSPDERSRRPYGE